MTSATLMGAARQIAQNKATPPTTGLAVALPYRDGRAAVAHVRPLDFGDLCRRSGTAAVIFITQAAEHAPPPVGALMTLFNLTWSEARVLEQIVSGRNRREAAAVLGVANSTVKTHLDNIYAKTGTSDQLGLCRLAAKLSWPICSVERHKRNSNFVHCASSAALRVFTIGDLPYCFAGVLSLRRSARFVVLVTETRRRSRTRAANAIFSV